jgi:hypothetical protein
MQYVSTRPIFLFSGYERIQHTRTVKAEIATDPVLEGEPSIPDEFILLDEVAEPDCTDLEVSRPGGTSTADFPQIYDSHFHQDRTSKWIWDN